MLHERAAERLTAGSKPNINEKGPTPHRVMISAAGGSPLRIAIDCESLALANEVILHLLAIRLKFNRGDKLRCHTNSPFCS